MPSFILFVSDRRSPVFLVHSMFSLHPQEEPITSSYSNAHASLLVRQNCSRHVVKWKSCRTRSRHRTVSYPSRSYVADFGRRRRLFLRISGFRNLSRHGVAEVEVSLSGIDGGGRK